MKILILQDDFPPRSLGGAGIVAFNLAKGFQKAGHKVYVITTVREKSQVGESNYQGLIIFRLYADYHERWRGYLSLYNPQTVSRVKELMKQIKPDKVHVHNIHYYLSYYCLKLAKKYSQNVFLTAHDVMLFHYGKLFEFINPDDFSIPKRFNYKITPWQQIKRFKKRYNPFRNIIIRHYLKYVDKIFAVSYVLKDALFQNSIKNVEVIYNGIDINNWQIDEDKKISFRKKYNLFNKKIIFFGGRLSSFKGGKEILMATKMARKKFPELFLLVAGRRDDYARKMLKWAKEEDIPLKITGWLEKDELKNAYFSSEIVVTPSLCLDTFNLINIEAMACQKPVIASCFGGGQEIVVNNQTGYIVNPLDIQTFANKIIDLLKNHKKSENFSQAEYLRVVQKFSLKEQVRQYIEQFNIIR